MEQYDVVILGGGPAGITAAIYCKRVGLSTLLLDTYAIGGNINNYTGIENIPGFGKVTTDKVAEAFIDHLKQLNIDYHEFCEVTDVDTDEHIVYTIDRQFRYRYLILATGSKPKQLSIPIADDCKEHIHYCAICDGPLYQDKIVAVIGGGNSACEEALGLAKICKEVRILECMDKLNADQVTLDKVYNTENIKVFTGIKLNKIDMYGNFLSLDTSGHSFRYMADIDGIFVYIGMIPNIPASLQDKLKLSNSGFILVNNDMQTSVSNVYAVGDVIDKKYRQVVTAMADGAIAAIHIAKNS